MEDGYCSDKGTNRLSISWSKDERDWVDRVEEEVRDNNKRWRELDEESDESDNNMSNNNDDNILGCGSKKRHQKRLQSVRGGVEDVGKETRVLMGDKRARR